MQKVVALCKRRGFIYPGSEIYGGLANTWDYGPYGVELKNNVKQFWWQHFVRMREDVVGLDGAILMNPTVWEASGHVGNFTDPLMDCKECNERVRADKLVEEKLGIDMAVGKGLDELQMIIKDHGLECPNCGSKNFTEARAFNLMFKTHQGVVEESQSLVYLRPETAQTIFVNFKNVVDSTRVKLPFGIAQIGKAFRNEITPGNFTFRTREFEQMEIEYFVKPGDQEKYFDEWKQAVWDFYKGIGVREDKMRWRAHDADELSHYSSRTEDIEYEFPFGWGELFGLADRGQFDLSQHEEFSKQKLHYQDPQTNEKFVPAVIEPSFGCDRSVLTVMLDAYREDEMGGETRVYMAFDPKVAPVKVAVFPLMKKEELQGPAKEIYNSLKSKFNVEYDQSGAIGKRYRRQDEIGTPYCITVDYDGLEDGTVTLRDRDTGEQKRIKIDEIDKYLVL